MLTQTVGVVAFAERDDAEVREAVEALESAEATPDCWVIVGGAGEAGLELAVELEEEDWAFLGFFLVVLLFGVWLDDGVCADEGV